MSGHSISRKLINLFLYTKNGGAVRAAGGCAVTVTLASGSELKSIY